MNAVHAWALLNARGARLDGAGGGIPILTASEIARLLQGLERGPFLMGMVSEAGDVAMICELEWRLAEEIRSDIQLAALAVFEVLCGRPNRCPDCNGRGYTIIEHQGVVCLSCAQSGGQKLSARQCALLASIPESSWRDTWGMRYQKVYAHAAGWRGDAIRHLAQRLDLMRAAA